MGANPLLSVVALARGRMALAGERPAEAYADLIRIFTDDGFCLPTFRPWLGARRPGGGRRPR